MRIQEIAEKSVYKKVWSDNNLHALQAWEWGVVKEIEGWKANRLGLITSDSAEKETIPASIIYIQSKNIPLFNKKLGYIPKLGSDIWLSNEAQTLLNEYLKSNNFAFVIYEFDKNISESAISKLERFNNNIQPEQTDQVTLGKSEDELFANLDGKYRRNIKKAIREDVQIEIFTEGEEALNHFYNIMQSIFANTGLHKRDKRYFAKLWESEKGNVHIFVATRHGESIGAYLVLNDNTSAYELYGGVNKIGREHEAGYLLKWEAIRYFNNKGFKIYDHWGVSPKLENGEYMNTHPLYNISKFKQGFGGNYVQFPKARVKVFAKLIYILFSLYRRIKG